MVLCTIGLDIPRAERSHPMSVQSFLHTIDGITTWVGKAAAWLMIVLMSVVCIEVFKRYIMNMPTSWIFDLDNMLYGSLFMLCGAYTLAQNAHVRGDFLYSSMRPRTQATLDLVLYIVFFLPGIAALVYAGYFYAADSWHIAEHSNVTADGPPVYHFKSVIPIAGALIMLQGIAEIVRCVVCLKTGEWPSRLKDVAEIDVIEEQLAHSEYVDEESRKIAIEGAPRIDEMARQRGMGGDVQHMSDPGTRPVDAGAHRRRHHDGLCHGLHADGPWHVLRLHRVLRPVAELDAEQRLRPDGPAHLRRDDQRRPDLDPAVRADGLRDGARRAGRQDVLFDPARVPPRAGFAGGRDPDRLHVLGHRQRAWSARSWC